MNYGLLIFNLLLTCLTCGCILKYKVFEKQTFITRYLEENQTDYLF